MSTTDNGNAFCTSCGAQIKQAAELCPECGVRQSEPVSSGSGGGTAVALAVVGFFVPILAGAGQFQNGDPGKGMIITIVQLVNLALMLVLIGFFTYPIVSLIAIIDAHNSAE